MTTTATSPQASPAKRAAIAIAVTVAATALVMWALGDAAYLWVKAVHVIAIISWMAGMLYLPRLFTTGPWPEMIAKWDELLATRPQPIVAIGGSDAHAHTYRLGPLQRLFLSYQDCFAAVNTHLLAPEPFNGDLAHDRRLVYDALRAGHAWVGYDLPGATRGFRFTASNGTDCAIMGDALAANGQLVRFDINAPGQASVRLLRNGQLAAQTQNGALEILPPEAPLILFVWSKSRVVAVRVTEFSVTEEAFDPSLNPIRAKVSLGMRVLSTDDLGFTHKGGTVFMSYLRTRETLAKKAGSASLASIGLTHLP